MNALRRTLMLLVVATMPSAAVADGEPQPPPSPALSALPAVPPDVPDQAMIQSMESRMRAHMETVVARMRSSNLELRRNVLGILTPQQRALVATTIGELAVSTQRDDAAAAGRIDAALSPAQRQAVLQIVSANMAQRAADFQNLVRQNALLPDQLPALTQHAPSQPLPQHLEAQVSSEPIVAGVGVPYGPYGAAAQTLAGGVVLSVLGMPLAQPFTPPVILVRPH